MSQLQSAMAGLHEDYAMAVLDESSEMPQAIMATVEAALGDLDIAAWVRVNVLGEFREASVSALLGIEEVERR